MKERRNSDSLSKKIIRTVLAIKQTITNYKRRYLIGRYFPHYVDDLSIEIVKKRIAWLETNQLLALLVDYIKLGYDNWNVPELDIYEENKIFYLSGEGDRYEYCALLLKHSKYSDRFKMIGTDIHSWEKAGLQDVLISIMPNKELQRKRNKELKERYPDRIVHVTPYNGILIGLTGWQYFDVFSPKKDEVFVNAGAFQGETDVDFAKWTNNSYKKIFAFEPMKEDVKICRKCYAENKIENVELFAKGTWSETGYISFVEGTNQGRIDENGGNRIETIKIDDAVKGFGGSITFIKMDIEGAELRALQGAKETILRDKPRMAICIYHKSEDLYEIPGYILSLVPEYQFKVRQYTSMNWETVLYAAVEGDW